ncbi:hypothetical protein HPP92_025777 [Vanilla planifolia]|uniref:PLATZ transcription factor family protein n=1 Tax=Vanilla planifolia TaxID=51239 RepID=A0A835U9C6_VANPL|nr:hypothetical protein HPP92_025777 [Vanilla planifolia]
MFCLDCGGGPRGGAFCLYCRSELHARHRVIQVTAAFYLSNPQILLPSSSESDRNVGEQIRRSSYHDVVRMAEIQKVLDISGVQTYVINSARVLFLNERPQPRASGKGASPHTCEICARSLLDPFRFCSLGCKLVGIKRNGDASFVPSPAGEEEAEAEAASSGVGRRWEEVLTAEDDSKESHKPPNSRRRKGVPRRAPFFS